MRRSWNQTSAIIETSSGLREATQEEEQERREQLEERREEREREREEREERAERDRRDERRAEREAREAREARERIWEPARSGQLGGGRLRSEQRVSMSAMQPSPDSAASVASPGQQSHSMLCSLVSWVRWLPCCSVQRQLEVEVTVRNALSAHLGISMAHPEATLVLRLRIWMWRTGSPSPASKFAATSESEWACGRREG